MIPTFLDLRTGKTAKGDDMSVFWWTDGNGTCDCNRLIAFGERLPATADCLGCKRFVAIDVEETAKDRNEEVLTKEQALIALNAGYGK
jgi:hypothetical protein